MKNVLNKRAIFERLMSEVRRVVEEAIMDEETMPSRHIHGKIEHCTLYVPAIPGGKSILVLGDTLKSAQGTYNVKTVTRCTTDGRICNTMHSLDSAPMQLFNMLNDDLTVSVHVYAAEQSIDDDNNLQDVHIIIDSEDDHYFMNGDNEREYVKVPKRLVIVKK